MDQKLYLESQHGRTEHSLFSIGGSGRPNVGMSERGGHSWGGSYIVGPRVKSALQLVPGLREVSVYVWGTV